MVLRPARSECQQLCQRDWDKWDGRVLVVRGRLIYRSTDHGTADLAMRHSSPGICRVHAGPAARLNRGGGHGRQHSIRKEAPMQLRDVMTRRVEGVTPGMTLQEAAQRMRSMDIGV